MKKIIVDTNALLRYFLNDIPDQNRAITALLQEAKAKKAYLFVPQIVVFELYFVLDTYYRTPKSDILTTLKSLLSTDYIEIESRETFMASLLKYKSSNLGLVDCFLLAVARAQKADIFTFDRKLKTSTS